MDVDKHLQIFEFALLIWITVSDIQIHIRNVELDSEILQFKNAWF